LEFSDSTGALLQGVSRSFGIGAAEVVAVHEVSLRLRPGELTAIVGPSGSGKSTLLNILGGMDTADSGLGKLNGFTFTGLNPRQLNAYRRDRIGFVFQFYNLIPQLTALENVQLAQRLRAGAADAQTAEALLASVGLAERQNHFPHELSGGQMQRVSIARALAKSPELLLCDEPTGALDSTSGAQVMTLLSDAARDSRTIVVIVTHDHGIRDTADHVVEMKDGRIVADTRPTGT